MKPVLFLIVFLAACAPVTVETVYYEEYCGTGAVYQCGEYVRVLGEENLVYKDGVEICGENPEAPECTSALHETCTLMHECQTLTLCDERPEVCTMEYDPVCAQVDTGIRCITTPCPSTEHRTYSNACSACADQDVIGYVRGECGGRKLAVCDTAPEWAQTGEYECVSACPEGYDSFMTQIGLLRCIPHMDEEFFEKRSGCLRTTDNCSCVKVERSTDGTPLDLGYRCVENEDYEEFLIHTSGLCTKDRAGIESCVIA